jgi:NTE family protein
VVAKRVCDLVLEGGGVKGLATTGAVMRILDEGYAVARAAGTSVGAMVAALVAAGADRARLEAAMTDLELDRVPDRLVPAPVLGESIGLLAQSGLYRGHFIHEWVGGQLKDLGVVTFGDLRRADPGDDVTLQPEQRYSLVVLATDVTRGRLLRLPWDYHYFGLDPDKQRVADAVRMSLSIPFYFEPCVLSGPGPKQRSTIVDGGVLSNFAVDIFDRRDGAPARWPTFGVRIIPDLPAGLGDLFPLLKYQPLPALKILQDVVTTALVGHDQTQLDRPEIRARTIAVESPGVSITDFGLPPARQRELTQRGWAAADAFLTRWQAGATA